MSTLAWRLRGIADEVSDAASLVFGNVRKESDYYDPAFRAMIATDLDRIGRVWLERRLAAMTVQPIASYDPARIDLSPILETYHGSFGYRPLVTPAALLSLLCPEVPRA